MNKLERCKRASNIFTNFLLDACDDSVYPDHRLNISSLLIGSILPDVEDEADEACYSASLSYKISDRKVLCLYLSVWLFMRDEVDVLFDDLINSKYEDCENEILDRISLAVEDSHKDRVFKKGLRKVLIHLNGSERRFKEVD